MAINFRKYTNNENQVKKLEEIYNELTNTLHISLKCGAYSFHVDPYGFNSVTVWVNDEMVGDFKTVDDFFLTYLIGGKPLVECVDELDYDY